MEVCDHRDTQPSKARTINLNLIDEAVNFVDIKEGKSWQTIQLG